MGALRRCAAVVVVLAVLATMAACGSSSKGPSGVDDPGAVAGDGQPAPAWFPAEFRAPSGSVIVEAIDDPEPTFGRTVTWRTTLGFDAVTSYVENTMRSLGWTPTNTTEDGDDGSRRTTFFIENGTVFSIRVFEDEALEGVRLAVELPAAS